MAVVLRFTGQPRGAVIGQHEGFSLGLPQGREVHGHWSRTALTEELLGPAQLGRQGLFGKYLFTEREMYSRQPSRNDAERHRRKKERLDAAAGVEGIEAFHDECVAAGATVIRPLAPTPWGTKDFCIEDPDGNIIAFGGRPGCAP